MNQLPNADQPGSTGNSNKEWFYEAVIAVTPALLLLVESSAVRKFVRSSPIVPAS